MLVAGWPVIKSSCACCRFSELKGLLTLRLHGDKKVAPPHSVIGTFELGRLIADLPCLEELIAMTFCDGAGDGAGDGDERSGEAQVCSCAAVDPHTRVEFSHLTHTTHTLRA